MDSGTISELTPRIKRVLKILEPTTLPMLISFIPFTALFMLTEASGALVPIETRVRPIIRGGILSAFAISLEPLTNQSAPFTSKTIPTISNRISRAI